MQLGDPAAFFVGRNPDGIDSFVTGIIKAGFGAGGDDVTSAALEKLMQVNPLLHADSLIW